MFKALADHQDELVALCSRYGVRRLEVIGSAARGEGGPQDVDLLVEFAERSEDAFTRFFDLKDELETILALPVDLISTRSLENRAFCAAIASDRTAIYEQ